MKFGALVLGRQFLQPKRYFLHSPVYVAAISIQCGGVHAARRGHSLDRPNRQFQRQRPGRESEHSPRPAQARSTRARKNDNRRRTERDRRVQNVDENRVRGTCFQGERELHRARPTSIKAVDTRWRRPGRCVGDQRLQPRTTPASHQRHSQLGRRRRIRLDHRQRRRAVLTVSSLVQNTITLGAGTTLIIKAIPGGPLADESLRTITVSRAACSCC